jgi:hypothetical protein
MRLRRALTLTGALLALTLLGGAQAEAARDRVNPPTLLWKTYPLIQDPFSPHYGFRATAVGGLPHPLPARIPQGGSGMTMQTLVLMLVSLVAGVAGLLLLRSTLAHAGYDWSPTRPRRKQPKKPRVDSTDDMLVALEPSTAVRPEPEEDLHEALQPIAAEAAGGGGEEQDEAVAPVAAEAAREPGESATEPRPGEPRRLLQFPRPLDRRVKESAERRVQRCEIRLWQGYVKYQLHASREGASFALSDFFRLRDADVPTKAALAELEDLITRLEVMGWAVVGEGPRWYDVELERAAD